MKVHAKSGRTRFTAHVRGLQVEIVRNNADGEAVFYVPFSLIKALMHAHLRRRLDGLMDGLLEKLLDT